MTGTVCHPTKGSLPLSGAVTVMEFRQREKPLWSKEHLVAKAI